MAESNTADNNNNESTNNNPPGRVDPSQNKKRTRFDMNNNELVNDPLLQNAKRQRRCDQDTNRQNEENTNNNNITKEDMDFLFQMKEQNNNNHSHRKLRSSLHDTNGHTANSTNHNNGNLTTDINQVSFFAAPSIASTTNSTSIDALSTTAAIHTNPPSLFGMESDNDMNCSIRPIKEKVTEKYCKHIVHRSSRVGERYQATILPSVRPLQSTVSNAVDDVKYGGSPSQVESPMTVAEKLREERNEKRSVLDQQTDADADADHDHDHEADDAKPEHLVRFNEMNFDEEEDDDDEDEDFNMDAYGCDSHEQKNENHSMRVMEGIMGRKCDWLPGDEGKPFDDNTRIQYLVKWKDCAQPEWEYADTLEMYREKIDLFEDDEMDEVLCETDALNVEASCDQNAVNGHKDTEAETK